MTIKMDEACLRIEKAQAIKRISTLLQAYDVAVLQEFELGLLLPPHECTPAVDQPGAGSPRYARLRLIRAGRAGRAPDAQSASHRSPRTSA